LYDHRTIAEIVICGGRESNLVRDHLRIANEGIYPDNGGARIPWERNQSMGWVNSARYERQSEPGFERSHLHLLPRRKLRRFNTFARIFGTPWRRACGPGPDFHQAVAALRLHRDRTMFPIAQGTRHQIRDTMYRPPAIRRGGFLLQQWGG
jgi:hypothetical protein